MKKTGFLLIVSLLLSSCNLSEKFDQMQKMNDDLEEHFKHDNITMSIGFGTNEEDNNVEVTFYEYDVSSTEYPKLKDISQKVVERLHSKYPNFRKKTFIEVRFTEEPKSDDNSSFVSFKHKN